MTFSHTKEQSLKTVDDFRKKHNLSKDDEVTIWYDHTENKVYAEK